MIVVVVNISEPAADAVHKFAHPAHRPRVFISYARMDGESVAREVRRRLVAGPPALTVWQDRAELEGGIGWWKQITDALDVVEFLILLMTPAAQHSGMVQREWRYARQQGVCVYPVFDPAVPPDFGALPRWMSKLHFFDLDKEWDTLVAHLARPAVVSRIPFMAPELVRGFVARPEVMHPLREALLAFSSGPVAITTALQGAGGLGKTTLAVALCHDEDVIEAFNDGIVWVTLGNEPKLLDELAKIYVALTGRRPAFVDHDDAAFHLAQTLEERNCLIVIDDVWHTAHLRPFLRGGRGCVRLITTRLADIAPDARRFVVDAMNLSQATILLSKGLGPDWRETVDLRRLAVRLGEWPLLLELANAHLRRRVEKGDTLQGSVAHAEQRLQRDGITAFDMRRAEQRKEAVARTMQLSLDLLDVAEVEAFSLLGVFPEDVEIPLAVAGKLWGRDAFESEELAQLLDDISLARFSLRTGTLHLHDLVRAYAATRLPDAASVHAALAACLAEPGQGISAYAWRWRPYHLAQAGQVEMLRSLLLDPDWLLVKLQNSDVVALGEDFDLIDEAPLLLVQQAIKLAAAVLAHDASELPAQLLARLASDPSQPDWQRLRDRIAACRGVNWLRPMRALSTPAGSANVGTLSVNAEPVLCLALADDGVQLASGAADGTVRVWDWRRGRLLSTMAGHASRVRALAFAPGGEQLASAGEDACVRLWDSRTGTARTQWALMGGPVRQIIASRSASALWWVVTGGALWALHTDGQEPPRLMIGPEARLEQLAILSDELWMGVCGQRCLQAWRHENEAWHAIRSVRLPHLATITACRDTAFSAGNDGALRRWALQDLTGPASGDGAQAAVAPTSLPPPLAMVFDAMLLDVDPQARFLATAGREWNVGVLPLSPPGVLRSLAGHTGPVNAVCVVPDATHVLSASDDGTIRVWDLRRAAAVKPRPAHLQAVRALAITPDGRHAFSTADGQELLVWNCATSEPCARLDAPGAWRAETPDGAVWAVWLLAGARLHIRPLAAEGWPVILHQGALRAQRITLAESTTLVFEAGRLLTAWCGVPAQCTLAVATSADFAHDVAFSADGSHFALLGTDGFLSQWQLAPVLEVQRQAAPRGALALAPRGRALALAPVVGGVQLLRPGIAPRGLPVGAAGQVRDIAFTRGESLLLCAGADGVLRVWDMERDTQHAAFTIESPLRCCAAAADGSMLGAGDEDGQVHFLELLDAKAKSYGAECPS